MDIEHYALLLRLAMTPNTKRSRAASTEIVILAGGLSRRMGTDKTRLRLADRTLLAHVRAAAAGSGLPVRVVRRDRLPPAVCGGAWSDTRSRAQERGRSEEAPLEEKEASSAVPHWRCGPLGGIYTALKNTGARQVVFLACDMPFVTCELIEWLLARFDPASCALFVRDGRRAGFPFVLRRTALPTVVEQIQHGILSLQALARRLGARALPLPHRFSRQLRNLNTPAELQRAQRCLAVFGVVGQHRMRVPRVGGTKRRRRRHTPTYSK